MPPELVQFLSLPFFATVGVFCKVAWDAIASKRSHKVSTQQVSISEKEANTHQFQAIVEGFTQSMAVISNRATVAEAQAQKATEQAERANNRAEALENRLDVMERERTDIIAHLGVVELMVPNPPGPPPRPPWLI